MRFAFIVMAAMLVAASAFAATPFKDVPRDHWAYDAIQRCVDAGILQGIDGQFHGKKLLNRYQMAVVVAKILDQVKGGLPAGAAPKPTDIQNLEALTIEFADELALLNVKVSTLEDSFVELKHEVEKLKGTGPAVAGAPAGGGSGFGLTGFTAFALVNRGDESGPAPYDGEADATFFTLPLVAIGINKDLGQGVNFDVRLNYRSDVDQADSLAQLDHANFNVDELFGKGAAARVGGFSPPMSMEHNGAFQTCDLTITPSLLSTGWRTYSAYGLELQNAATKKAKSDFEWRFAVLSGTDVAPLNTNSLGHHMMQQGGEFTSNLQTAVEDDGNMGYYLFLKKPRGEKGFGFNFFYFDNGGDAGPATAPALASAEADAVGIGFEYAKNDMLLMAQYQQASWMAAGSTVDADTTDWYFLFNYKLKAKQSVTLRYEATEYEDLTDNGMTILTLAWNRLVTDTSMFQFEYLSFNNEDLTGTNDDVDDNVIQLRYKVWF